MTRKIPLKIRLSQEDLAYLKPLAENYTTAIEKCIKAHRKLHEASIFWRDLLKPKEKSVADRLIKYALK